MRSAPTPHADRQISLDANEENPETRTFARPRGEVLADRGRYIAAILTIVRAYRVAGSPANCRPPELRLLVNNVRSALVWLGWAT